jgi:hypothetical protein
MSNDYLHLGRYAKFFRERGKAKGYDFHHAPSGSVPPPKVTFMDSLRWWSLDRWKRMKKIRQERDRRLQEIFQIKPPLSK